ncbi:ArsR/SmtB family transcription factor [Desulfitobacterium metallireducens]|uniref:Regulatory protein ArsR n=1 Tax=Desulfitobacterium metallireducens DSM 15288 TaxID=871968 RepID=W0EAM8_9FIRM|nr:metalloregulator ArsR/SmtB family transcription factor [Desulfitobacterium metallireducens]AHF06259.1 regulatory protein ArsR [Desulfitobacterium metallireducens DSM 15288]
MEDQITKIKSDFFKALAHPTRVAILERIADQEVCVCEIIEDLGLEQSNVSQHLAILRKQNIITSTKAGLQVHYQIKYPEVLEILKTVESIMTKQLNETQELIRHLGGR